MMSTRNRSRNTRRRGRGASSSASTQAITRGMIRASQVTNPEPPMFEVSHHYVQRCRFVVSNAVQNYAITATDIANLMLTVVTFGPTPSEQINTVPLWTRFLIKSVEMWATATALTTPATITLTMGDTDTSTATNTEQTKTDTAKSIDQYAYVKMKPKVTSPAGQWQNSTTTGGSLIFTCPSGTIVDLWLHVYLNNNDPVEIVTVFNNNPQIIQGSIIMNYLDSNAFTAGYFLPQGYLNLNGTSEPTPRPT